MAPQTAYFSSVPLEEAWPLCWPRRGHLPRGALPMRARNRLLSCPASFFPSASSEIWSCSLPGYSCLFHRKARALPQPFLLPTLAFLSDHQTGQVLRGVPTAPPMVPGPRLTTGAPHPASAWFLLLGAPRQSWQKFLPELCFCWGPSHLLSQRWELAGTITLCRATRNLTATPGRSGPPGPVIWLYPYLLLVLSCFSKSIYIWFKGIFFCRNHK